MGCPRGRGPRGRRCSGGGGRWRTCTNNQARASALFADLIARQGGWSLSRSFETQHAERGAHQTAVRRLQLQPARHQHSAWERQPLAGQQTLHWMHPLLRWELAPDTRCSQALVALEFAECQLEEMMAQLLSWRQLAAFPPRPQPPAVAAPRAPAPVRAGSLSR